MRSMFPAGAAPPPRSILRTDALQLYVKRFGEQPADRGLVALADGAPVGAVWARIMDDYGHIDNDTPSLAMSVREEYRGHGIGTALLWAMLTLLEQSGCARVSLSVQAENYAVKMYRKAGFRIVDARAGEYLMLRTL